MSWNLKDVIGIVAGVIFARFVMILIRKHWGETLNRLEEALALRIEPIGEWLVDTAEFVRARLRPDPPGLQPHPVVAAGPLVPADVVRRCDSGQCGSRASNPDPQPVHRSRDPHGTGSRTPHVLDALLCEEFIALRGGS